MASGKAALLKWCQNNTQGHANVNVRNFTTSWADGLAFCALIHNFRPDLIPFDTLSPSKAEHNLTLAFETAEKLGIPPLLDVEDIVDLPKPEPFSIMTYLSQFYHFFKSNNAKACGGGIASIRVDASPAPAKTTALPARSATSTATPAARQKKPLTAAESNAGLCAGCGKSLRGNTVDAPGGMYHEACFKCAVCKRALGGRCANINGKPHCEPCGRAAFEKSSSSSAGGPSNASAAAAVIQAAARRKREEEEKRKKEAERKKKAEEEASKKAQEEEQRRKKMEAEEERKRKAREQEEERKRKAKEAEEERKRKAKEAEEERKRKAREQEEERRKKAKEAEEERKRKAKEQEARAKALEDKRREEEAQRAREREQAEREQQAALLKKKEEEAAREEAAQEERDRALAEKKRKADEAARRKEEEAQRKAEEKRLRDEEKRKKEEVERERRDSERAKREEEKRARLEDKRATKEESSSATKAPSWREKLAAKKKEREAREAKEREERQAKIEAAKKRSTPSSASTSSPSPASPPASSTVAAASGTSSSHAVAKSGSPKDLSSDSQGVSCAKRGTDNAKSSSSSGGSATSSSGASSGAGQSKVPAWKAKAMEAKKEREAQEQKEREARKAKMEAAKKPAGGSSDPVRSPSPSPAQATAVAASGAVQTPATTAKEGEKEAESSVHSSDVTTGADEGTIDAAGDIDAAGGVSASDTEEHSATDCAPSFDDLFEDVQTFAWDDRVTRLDGYLWKYATAEDSSGGLMKPQSRIRRLTGGASFLLSKMKDPWQRFWFVIRDGKLVFYKDKPKAEGERFVGVISLDAVVSILPDEDAPRAHSFTIHGETTEWKLAAESEGEEQLWICGLYHAINACHWENYDDGQQKEKEVTPFQSRQGDISRHEQTRDGALEVHGRLGWKKRWCVLRDGFLLVYKKKGEKRQRARIPLYQAELDEYKPMKEPAAFKIKSEHGEFVLRASDEEQMQFWLNAIVVEKHTIETLIDDIQLE